MSRERLAKLLGMLGSEFDGERANAAAMIAKMAKEAKMGVAEFVMGGGGPQIIYRDRIVEKTVYRDRPTAYDEELRKAQADFMRGAAEEFARQASRKSKPKNTDEDVIAGLRWARDFPQHLTDFEVEFIGDLFMKGFTAYDLSWKQEKVARRIIAKVKAYEGEPLI